MSPEAARGDNEGKLFKCGGVGTFSWLVGCPLEWMRRLIDGGSGSSIVFELHSKSRSAVNMTT